MTKNETPEVIGLNWKRDRLWATLWSHGEHLDNCPAKPKGRPLDKACTCGLGDTLRETTADAPVPAGLTETASTA